VVGESKIFYFKKQEDCRIAQVRLIPEHPKALPAALAAIQEADMLLLGPGSLYTSIIPNLLVDGIVEAIQQSEYLLQMTLDGHADVVAKMIDEVHADNTSVLKYNDENSLACVLSLAYYTASKYYTILRELPAGLGFADLVMLPKRNVQKPVLVIELKYDKTADSAITQIKENRYARNLFAHAEEVLLVGINYDKKTKVHSCEIERIVRK
jgi:hypothetical protein